MRTGAEYLRSLKDGRRVFVDGERVGDFAAHPAFRGAARSIANLYDIAAAPELRGRIELAHRLAWSRPPSLAESERATAYMNAYSDELFQAGTPSERIELEAWISYARILLGADELMYVD